MRRIRHTLMLFATPFSLLLFSFAYERARFFHLAFITIISTFFH